jgi:uncharacterized membrane protein YraQ (UPF0718 family)
VPRTRDVHPGAITVFLNLQAVMRYLGPREAPLAYGVASVSGAILAVCSCTVLPIFKGIYKKGAGLGPAVAFLYSGPAINILAIVLSAKVFGWKLGVARAVGAVVFSIVIGFFMAAIFRKDDEKRAADARMFAAPDEKPARSLGQMVVLHGFHDRHPRLRQLGEFERRKPGLGRDLRG